MVKLTAAFSAGTRVQQCNGAVFRERQTLHIETASVLHSLSAHRILKHYMWLHHITLHVVTSHLQPEGDCSGVISADAATSTSLSAGGQLTPFICLCQQSPISNL